MTTYSVENGHAEPLRECPMGGFHEWVDSTVSAYTIEARICGKCGLEQVWRLKQRPTPQNAPQLGRWEDRI